MQTHPMPCVWSAPWLIHLQASSVHAICRGGRRKLAESLSVSASMWVSEVTGRTNVAEGSNWSAVQGAAVPLPDDSVLLQLVRGPQKRSAQAGIRCHGRAVLPGWFSESSAGTLTPRYITGIRLPLSTCSASVEDSGWHEVCLSYTIELRPGCASTRCHNHVAATAWVARTREP